MPRVLSTRALELLDDMPPYYREDPLTQAVIGAQANEMQRIEDTATAIRDALFPSQATDVSVLNGAAVAPILSMWETLLGLPVAPPVTLAERQSKVLAHIQKRNSGEGIDWVDNLTEALGTDSWTHQEGPGDYQVTIRVPYAAGSYTAGQALALAREISPAHEDVTAGYSEGFLIGVSLIGVDAL